MWQQLAFPHQWVGAYLLVVSLYKGSTQSRAQRMCPSAYESFRSTLAAQPHPAWSCPTNCLFFLAEPNMFCLGHNDSWLSWLGPRRNAEGSIFASVEHETWPTTWPLNWQIVSDNPKYREVTEWQQYPTNSWLYRVFWTLNAALQAFALLMFAFALIRWLYHRFPTLSIEL